MTGPNHLSVEIDATEAGFDPDRLQRIDRHFARYVDNGRLAGWLAVVARRGKVVHIGRGGSRDLESGAPVEVDTIWRLYSMTKPVTSVAAMMLYEQGAFSLKDPVSRWIPSFADARVWKGGSTLAPVSRPAVEPVRLWHLLTHTSGLTYGFHHAHPVDGLYRRAGYEWGTPRGKDLAEVCDDLAALPLLFEPGSEWNYSMSTDVLGRVVEIVSGLGLDEFFRQHIFEPLDMTDAAFWVGADRSDRLAALYGAGRDKRAVPADGSWSLHRPRCLSGGGGLMGTARDYHRFTQMLANRGRLGGARLLGSRTVDFMTRNHLPGGADLRHFGRPLFSEADFDGTAFGLGFSVVVDPAEARVLSPTGSYGWGGAASTTFAVEPAEDLTIQFFTQLMPSSTHPIRPELQALVHQALVD